MEKLSSQFAATLRDRMARQRLAESHPDMIAAEESFDMSDYTNEQEMAHMMQNTGVPRPVYRPKGS